MKLKKIQINNFRQFIEATIHFEDDITILGGANNSGKTSLVELFKNIFDSTRCNFSEDDIPVMSLKKWIDEIYISLESFFNDSSDKDKIIKKIQELFADEDKHLKSISVNFEIGYQDSENISKFADFLMDLDEKLKSFYFRFEFSVNIQKLIKKFDTIFEQLLSRFKAIKNIDKPPIDLESKVIHLKEKIALAYINSLEDKYYFTDSHYNNLVRMDTKSFKNLFNFKYINANRLLDDEVSDKSHSISKGMINFISNDEDWGNLVEELPDKISQPIENAGIKKKIQEKSLAGLTKAIEAISKTNGGNFEEIILDMDIDDESIKSLLKNITNAKYKVDTYYLKESSQGLGYSNLIFMHLQLENYLKLLDKSDVNFFIIEEPESHMHPQMQKVLIKYLFDYYKQKNIQGLITTHSIEIIKNTPLKKLRVIRQSKRFENQIYDMNYFLKEIEDIELKPFYNLFFNINFSNIIFADKIIMYEGDTERMYIQTILKLMKFRSLNEQYVAFVQVGGAYAHSYKEIINYLDIKTLILTDVDYNKTSQSKDEVLSSATTNSAIKAFYNDEQENEQEELTIKAIYDWQNGKDIEKCKDLILLRCQGEKDFYARTLEEAMLSKYFNIEFGAKWAQEEWKKSRKKSKLKFSIPNENQSDVRDIVTSTSNSKTDFMYSVIETNLVEEMLPNYIEEGLTWLMK